LPALRRLVAAYSIHLDVNNTSKDYYNWGALTGVARNLQTTPLYVFDYLNAWLRKQDTLDVAPAGRRAVYFDFYLRFDPEGEAMSHVQELVRRYREFYRAKRRNAKSNAILKPIEVAARALEETRKSGGVYASPEALTEAVAAEVSALMSRVRSRTAEGKPTFAFIDGRWRRALTPEQERQKAYEFAEYFVKELFIKEYSGDRTRLTGKQLNLLKSACEFLYRRADDEEKPNLPADEPEDIEAIEDIQQ
jgi:CRISPR-associated protein Csc3